MRFEMEEISTGGGCEHILIKYPDLGVCVLINNDCQKVPKLGECYDIGVYNLEPEGWMGEHFEGMFETFDNFDKRTIVVRTQGYLEGKGLEKCDYESIVDKALKQIKEDVEDGDLTAIEELLKRLPMEEIKGYLKEDV